MPERAPKHLNGLSFGPKSELPRRVLADFREPAGNTLHLFGGTPAEGAMIDILITSFVAAFITIALFGHVMVAKALITPDRNGVQRHLQQRRCQHPGSDLRPGRL